MAWTLDFLENKLTWDVKGGGSQCRGILHHEPPSRLTMDLNSVDENLGDLASRGLGARAQDFRIESLEVKSTKL